MKCKRFFLILTYAFALFSILNEQNVLAHAEDELPRQLEGVTIQERLGERIPPGLKFTDHQGQEVTLSDYFASGKPTILTLNYYKCANLCSFQLNALSDALKELDWSVGEKYQIVTVSINPKETPDLAAEKRNSYLNHMGWAEDSHWHFLTGDQNSIEALSKQVGFHYKYDPETDQYAHGAAVFFISDLGVVSRYLYGLEYKPRDIKFALIETSEGRLGSPLEKLILSCFHYDPSLGDYGPFAIGFMRLGGAVTVSFLGLWLGFLWRREKKLF